MPDPLPVPYDPAWAEQFAAAAREIEAALGPRLIGPVEHIGSTSVPGMMAKPIIDMMAPVASLEQARAASGPLGELGYVARPHRVDAVLYVRQPRHGVHLTERTGELWRERLAFRDALRSDAALRDEYRALKDELLARAGGSAYDSADKREFVRRVLADVGHALRDGMHADR